MAKQLLEIEDDFDFTLLGISCHAKDYRLCWALNKQLEFKFVREGDLEIISGKKHVKNGYTLFIYADEENFVEYFLIGNRSEDGLLIPEQKHMDFFLQIKGPMQTLKKEKLISDIRTIAIVNTAIEIDINTLKSKKNLLF